MREDDSGSLPHTIAGLAFRSSLTLLLTSSALHPPTMQYNRLVECATRNKGRSVPCQLLKTFILAQERKHLSPKKFLAPLS